MAWPEGFGDMHIAGAKKHRLVGDPWPEEPEVKVEPPLKTSAKPRPLKPAPRGQRGADEQQQGHPRQQIPLRQPRHRSGMEYLSSTNIFGLTSRCEQFYPELFQPISRLYWLRMSAIEQADLVRRQAEIVEKLGYRNEGEPTHIPSTQADLAYDAAVARRSMAMRRRRKKRGYEGKKQEEEERRKAPLVRRYIHRDARFGITPIMTVGALETPVVISGLLRKAPGRTRIDFEEPNYDQPSWTSKPPLLPVIDTRNSPQVKITDYNNMFGLRSRPVASYPEAYAKVSQAFWRSMTPEHRRSVMAVQASAMEKVGFEQGTTKYFIRDFDPMQQNIYSTGREGAKRKRKNQAQPTSLYACVLLILLGFVSAMPVLFSTADYGWLAFSAVLVITGVTLGIPVRR